MSAGQTSQFFSNIKSWVFLTFFYYVADVAKGIIQKREKNWIVN